MALVPALDLRPVEDHPHAPGFTAQGQPANIEAEQALLGCVLYDNAGYHLVEGLSADHFFEPFHGRLWEAIGDLVSKGVMAEPITLARKFDADPAFQELAGLRYLADLVDRAPPALGAPGYAQEIVEQANRRQLLVLTADAARATREGAVGCTEVVGYIEAGLLAMQVHDRRTTLMSAAMASARVLATLDAPPEQDGGILTGLAPLDRQLGPLLPGDLLLLMGRPSMGKSATAECIALNVTMPDILLRTDQVEPVPGIYMPPPTGIIQVNGEMSAEQMARRHLSDLCFHLHGQLGPKYSDMRKRAVTYDQRQMLGQAAEMLEGLPLEMVKRPGMKLAQLRSMARRQAAEWARRDIPLGALIIDHVGLLKTDQRMDRYEAQTEISNGLKELADELQCVVIGLNQMNRENERREDKRPQLSDLRDSGSWEQDADFVIGFYREAYYASREPEPKIEAGKPSTELAWAEWDRRKRSRTIEAIVLKAREGECGTVNLWGDVARNAIRGSEPTTNGGFL